MVRWSRSNKTIAAVAAFAVYFVLAGWSKLTWIDPVPKGSVLFRLERPFEVYREHGVSCYQLRAQEIFEALADTDDDPTRSPLLLYEDNHLLGPPHSRIEDVGCSDRAATPIPNGDWSSRRATTATSTQTSEPTGPCCRIDGADQGSTTLPCWATGCAIEFS